MEQIEDLGTEIAAIAGEINAAVVARERATAAITHAALALADAPDDRQLDRLYDTAQREVAQALERYQYLISREERLLKDRSALVARVVCPCKCALLPGCRVTLTLVTRIFSAAGDDLNERPYVWAVAAPYSDVLARQLTCRCLLQYMSFRVCLLGSSLICHMQTADDATFH